ncbi:MAG: ComEA family DNA-binding protein [Ruthenibacterium sp.]
MKKHHYRLAFCMALVLFTSVLSLTLPPLWQKEYKTIAVQRENANDVVNINTATAAELCCLPHIGTVKAQRIIAYRTQNGNFKNAEDLTQVTGISSRIAENLKELICFNE